MSTPTDLDRVVIDVVQRRAAEFDVAPRPIEQVRAHARRRHRRRRTLSAAAAGLLVLAGGVVTLRITGRDHTAVAGGFSWTRIDLPAGVEGAAAMVAVDGTGPFYGIELAGPDHDLIRVATSLDAVSWVPLSSLPPMDGAEYLQTQITASGDRVAVVGRLAVEHDGMRVGTLVAATSDDRGMTWRMTALPVGSTDIWSVDVALEPDGALVAVSGRSATDDAGYTSESSLFFHVDRAGRLAPVSADDLPGAGSWREVTLDESTDGIVLGGSAIDDEGRTIGAVYLQRFGDATRSWTELAPGAPEFGQPLLLADDLVFSVGRTAASGVDEPGVARLEVRVASTADSAPWRRTALDSVLPDDVRQRVHFVMPVLQRTAVEGAAGLAFPAQLVGRDVAASDDNGRSWLRDQGLSVIQLFYSADGTSWTTIPLDSVAQARVFFARPLMRDDGTLVVTVFVEANSSYRAIVLVGTPQG